MNAIRKKGWIAALSEETTTIMDVQALLNAPLTSIFK